MERAIKIGLVLSGGGSRGAYQAGALKALDDIGLSQYVTIVAGTSIGAINGAAFCQADFDMLEEIWKNLSYDKIFSSLKANRNLFLQIGYEFLKNGGVNVEPLKELIRDKIDYDKIYNNPIDFGLVVFNFSDVKPQYLLKEEIDRDDFIDFIIGSATFPIFERHIIKNRSYLDGGLYDNMPLQMVVDHPSDVDLIISIKISKYDSRIPFVSGSYDQLRLKKNLIEIEPSFPLGSIFNFQKKFTEKYFELGYLDTVKKLALLANKING